MMYAKRTLVVASALAFAWACGSNEPSQGGWSTVGDGWSELGETSSDPSDAATQDDVATSDAADGDAALNDTSVADTASDDSSTTSDASVDTSSQPDTSEAVDTAVADSGAADPCKSKQEAFAAAKAKALACNSDFQCYAPFKQEDGGFAFGGPEQLGCPCSQYYSDADLAGQSLADLQGEYAKLGCKTDCPAKPCMNLESHVGVCDAGQCVTKQATCKEMETLVAAAVEQGRSCTQDSECSPFGMQGGLPCGCPVNVNLSKLAPGKPLFLYVTMVTRAYNTLGCSKGVVCACEPVGAGACVNGQCVTKK